MIATFLAFAATAFVAPPAEREILFFTMDQCIYCEKVKPAIRALTKQGVSIREINASVTPQWAETFKVQSFPTFIVLEGNQEVVRHAGALSAQDLSALYQTPTPGVRYAPPPDLEQPRNFNIQQTSFASTEPAPTSNSGAPIGSPPASTPNYGNESPTSVFAGGNPNNAPNEFPANNSANDNLSRLQQRLLAATVRLRVDEGNADAVGTGTIIHTHGREALVLTCGHIFREAGRQARVIVEIGSGGNLVQHEGTILDYDAEEHDIGLVVFQTDLPVVAANIALPSFNLRENLPVFSIGCSNGNDPTLEPTQVKALTTYGTQTKVKKIDTFRRPVTGRSGGGLFTEGGQLIGVCNAAVMNIEEGIYTSLQSMYWLLEKNNLSQIFLEPQHLAGASSPQTMESQLRGNSDIRPAVAATSNEAVRTAAFASDAQPSSVIAPRENPTSSNPPSSPSEIIVLVRGPDGQTRPETLVINNPSPDLLRALQEAANRNRTEVSERPTRYAVPR